MAIVIPQPQAPAVYASSLRFPPARVLVPMDLSDASMAAWDCAQSLSRRFGSKLEAFYAQPWQISVAGMGVVEPYMRFHLGGFKPAVSVILPFAGDLADSKTFGVRGGFVGEF